jgi:DNA-directed RNA polymerase specialized sigma subunit
MEQRIYFTQDDLNTTQALVKAIDLVEFNQRIIALYRQGMTMQQIADQVHKSKMRVSQILATARKCGIDVPLHRQAAKRQPEPVKEQR